MPICLRRAYPRQVKTLIYASFIACCDIYATHLYHTESITMWYLCNTSTLFSLWGRLSIDRPMGPLELCASDSVGVGTPI
jgi:hypothetical protein